MRRTVPALDGVRGVAIALVLVLHSGYGPHFLGGGLGVDVFFVLSGFLITTLLLDEHDGAGRVDLGGFYVRRVLRLYPALLLMVIAAGVSYRQLPGGTWHDFWVAAVAVLLYVANFVAAFGSPHASGLDGIGHTWTLALEEQFYLIWPAVLILCLRAGRTWLPALVAALGVAASWISLEVWQGPLVGGIPQSYFRPDSRAGALLIGCLVALLLRHEAWRRVARWQPLIWAAAIGTALTIAAAGHGGVDYIRECIPAISVGAAIVIGGLAVRETSPLAAALSWRPLRALGWISYGVYLYSGLINSATERHTADWSTPTLAAFRTVTAIVAAVISYILIEQPIRRWGRERLVHRGHKPLTGDTTPVPT